MRVKTPWVEALTQSREAANGSQEQAQVVRSKPDLTPRKMSDTKYSAVWITLALDHRAWDNWLTMLNAGSTLGSG